jgi:hypothetical protein
MIGYAMNRLMFPVAKPEVGRTTKLSLPMTMPVHASIPLAMRPAALHDGRAGISNLVAVTISQSVPSTNPPEINVANSTDDERGNAEKEKYRLLHQLCNWATRDAEGALAAAMKLPAGAERDQALGEVCSGMAQNHPAEAVELAKTLHLDQQPGAVLEHLIQTWATSDVAAAADWVKAQAADGARDGLVTRVAYIQAQSAPAEAANLILDEMPAGPSQNDALLMVVHQWANKDAAAATAWVNEFPQGTLHDRANEELQLVAVRQQALASP